MSDDDQMKHLVTFLREMPESGGRDGLQIAGQAAADNPYRELARIACVCQDLALVLKPAMQEGMDLACRKVFAAIRLEGHPRAFFFSPTADAVSRALPVKSESDLGAVLRDLKLEDDRAPPAFTAIRLAVCGVALYALADEQASALSARAAARPTDALTASVWYREDLARAARMKLIMEARPAPFGWSFLAARTVDSPLVRQACDARNRARGAWA